jgi:hypothetical protein
MHFEDAQLRPLTAEGESGSVVWLSAASARLAPSTAPHGCPTDYTRHVKILHNSIQGVEAGLQMSESIERLCREHDIC